MKKIFKLEPIEYNRSSALVCAICCYILAIVMYLLLKYCQFLNILTWWFAAIWVFIGTGLIFVYKEWDKWNPKGGDNH